MDGFSTPACGHGIDLHAGRKRDHDIGALQYRGFRVARTEGLLGLLRGFAVACFSGRIVALAISQIGNQRQQLDHHQMAPASSGTDE